MGDIINEKDARGVKEMLLRDLDLEQVQPPCNQPSGSGAQNLLLNLLSFHRL